VSPMSALGPAIGGLGPIDILVVVPGQFQMIGPSARATFMRKGVLHTLCIADAAISGSACSSALIPGRPVRPYRRLRPPVFGPRRDRCVRQSIAWGRSFGGAPMGRPRHYTTMTPAPDHPSSQAHALAAQHARWITDG